MDNDNLNGASIIISSTDNSQQQQKKSSEEIDLKKDVKSKEDKKKVKTVSVRQMFRYATWSDMFLIILGILGALVNGSTIVINMLVLGDLFDAINYSGNAAGKAIAEKALYFVYIGIGAFVASALQVTCLTIASERITIRLREEYLNSVLKQDIAFFDSKNSGELATAVAENSIVFREAIGDKFGTLFQFLAMFVAGFILGFVKLYDLALVILATAPILAICGAIMMKVMGDVTGGQLQAYAESGAIAEETIAQIRTVAGLGIEKKRIQLYGEGLAKAERNGIKSARAQGIAIGTILFVMFSSYGLGFYYGSVIVSRDQVRATKEYPLSASLYAPFMPFCKVGSAIPQECTTQNVKGLVFESEVDVCNCPLCGCGCWAPDMLSNESGWKCATGGTVILTFFSVLMGAMSIGQAAPGITAFANGKAAAAKIYEVIDRKPAIYNHSEGKKADPDAVSNKLTAANVQGEIILKDIYYTYASRPDMPLFNGLNLTIPAGKTVALVGESGSGKSTIISLIERFYDPNAGVITLDGVDIRNLDPNWYRSLFGYVGQEPTLFATSIRRNIIFGVSGSDPTNEQIQRAAKSANAHDFIMNFPDTYETIVGGGGSQLSGGQKQRIAIARALVRDPKVLLLDEATSALDNQSERIVQKAIDEMIEREKRTTIIVAHRLSTVKNADIIIVLGKGKVIEQGNHDELMARNGTYAALVNIANKSGNNGGKEESSGQNSQPADDSSIQIEVNVDKSEKKDLPETLTVSVRADGVKDAKKEEGEKKKDDPKVKVSMSRAFQFAAPEKWWFIPGVICAAINGATFPIFSVIFSNMSNVYYLINEDSLNSESRFWALMFVCIAIGTGLSNCGQISIFGLISSKMTTRVRAATFRAVIRNEIGFFDMPENSVGAVSSTLATDASLVKAAISERVASSIMNLVTIIAGLIVAFIASWKVSLVILSIFPLLVAGAALQMVVMTGMAKTDQSALADAGQVLTESILGIRTVTALGIKNRVVSLYSSFLAGPMKLAIKKGFSAGLAFGFGQAIPLLANALAFWYGGSLITNGEITFQELLQSFFGIMMMSVALGQTSAMSSDIAKANPALKSIFSIIDRGTKIDPLTDVLGEKPSQFLGDISFKDVSFVYPARPEVEVLKGFSLDIKHGETVALVGASGSGKSTIVLMIERFYDPVSGEVFIDGKNTKDLNVTWLRGQLGYVGQEPQLFVGTILDNIKNGRLDATDEEVFDAAKASNAYDFIMSFPDKFQTQVGSKGTQLSGGQKQRIAIARAILRNPHILLLDEATSALDGESEAIVQAALDDLLAKQKRTTVIVAHRLSTVRNADKIVVLDKGIVVETGTYDELLAKPGGAFSKLYAAQSKHE